MTPIRLVALLVLVLGASSCIDAAQARPGESRRPRERTLMLGSASAFTNTHSCRLDGVDEYVTIPDHASFDAAPRTNLSVCVWARATTWAASDGLVAKSASASNISWRLLTGATATAIRWNVATAANDASTRCDTASRLTNNVKAFICGTFDGTQATATDRLEIYHNGADTGCTTTGTPPTAYLDGTPTVDIGRQNGAGYFGDGYLDEATIWAHTLTLAQHQCLYGDGTTYVDPRTCGIPNLISYYRCGDGDTFPTVSDQGGVNTNHGNATNMESTDFEATVP